MRHVDLFSGIGGFALGLQRTGGFKTVAFCEIDEKCRAVLEKNFPGVPKHTDVREFNAEQYRPDIITGGFPCQPFSTASAGKRSGVQDDRFLWPEMLRCVRASRPTWVVCENVYGFISLALEEVVSDLESSGYSVGTFVVPACAVGQEHRRTRVWICGYSNGGSKSGRAINAEARKLPESRGDARGVGKADGLSEGLDITPRDRLRMIGNAIVPQIAEEIGRAILGAEE